MKIVIKSRTIWLVAFLVTVWGINWPLSKLALAYTPPILFAGIRTLIGGMLLLIVAMPRYRSLRFRSTWKIYLVSSIFNIILYYGIQTIGLQYLPAGLFSVIVFLQPVLVGILSWMWLGEPMYGLKIAGLILGFAGVATISGGSLSGHVSTLGIVLALCTAVTWALGTVYVKKTSPNVDAIWLVTVQLIIGGGFMTALGSGVEKWSTIHWSVSFIVILSFICIFVIAGGWWVFFTLIHMGEASKVASFTFLIPLIAILVGAVFLHERITLYLIIGLILIIVSLYFVNKPRTNEKRSIEEVPQA